MHDRTVLVCERIWEEVKPVLCVDSPEGHTDEPVEDLNVGPKDILSYSWRALRESRYALLRTEFVHVLNQPVFYFTPHWPIPHTVPQAMME